MLATRHCQFNNECLYSECQVSSLKAFLATLLACTLLLLAVHFSVLRSVNCVTLTSRQSTAGRLPDVANSTTSPRHGQQRETGYNTKPAADSTRFNYETHDDRGHSVENESAATRPCIKRLPDCIIIGVQKCGTTALAKFLSAHPEVALRTEQAYYFTSNYFRGVGWYRDFLPCSAPGQVVVERTPQYFYSVRAARRARRANTHMKLILIACDPVRRVLSNFEMAKLRLRENTDTEIVEKIFSKIGSNKTVSEFSKYITRSNYFLHINHWLGEFSLDRFLVLDGKSFIDDPPRELQQVEHFLGISPYFKSEQFIINEETGFSCLKTKSGKDCLPRTKGRKLEKFDKITNGLLKNFFKDKNELFYQAIQKRFDW